MREGILRLKEMMAGGPSVTLCSEEIVAPQKSWKYGDSSPTLSVVGWMDRHGCREGDSAREVTTATE